MPPSFVVRNLLVGLFWLWVATSIAIYGYRIFRRIARGPKNAPETSDQPSRLTSTIAAAGTPQQVEPASPEPIVAPDIPAAPRPTATTRSGLFAPTPTSGTPSPDAARTSEARPTVAELLQGITMPCDLSPIVSGDRPIDPYRVAFSTATAPPETVGAAVGDELERLGFSLLSTATNRLSATKNDAELTITIHTDAARVTIGDEKAYPAVPAGSVVVEFRV